MRSIKKTLISLIIIIATLTNIVLAEGWPANYGTEPNESYTTYPYRYMIYHKWTNSTYYYALTKSLVMYTWDEGGGLGIKYMTNTFDGSSMSWIRYKLSTPSGVPTWTKETTSIIEGVKYTSDIKYTNFDMNQVTSPSNFTVVGLLHASDYFEPPPIANCTIYKVGVGDTLNIQNSTTTDQFFYFKATNATYEKILAIGTNQPTVNNYTNLSSGQWEWMEPETKANLNYWKIKQGTIEIGVPNGSPLVVKITRKVPTGGYDTIPSPDRGNYEAGIFGSISYGIDTLIYWVSYPFIAVGRLFVGLIEEIKLNLGWINDFTGLVGVLFGWIPERFQGLLFIGASATAISFIIRVFRGS